MKLSVAKNTIQFSVNRWLCYGFFLLGLFFFMGEIISPILGKARRCFVPECLYELFFTSFQQQPSRTLWIAGCPITLGVMRIWTYLRFSRGALYWAIQKQQQKTNLG